MTKKRVLWIVVTLLLLWGAYSVWSHRFGQPEDFDRMEAQFKYGSIGADHPLAQAPIPYWIWKVLPEVVSPTDMPAGQRPLNGLKSWDAFGLVVEAKPDRPRGWVGGQVPFERPIGFSRRRVLGMDFVGMNCAFCHLGTWRAEPGAPQQVVLGGTGTSIDIERYFLYLFFALDSPAFKGDAVMKAVDRELRRQGAALGWFQRIAYRIVIAVIPTYLRWLEREKFDFIDPGNPNRLPEFGPGRVDTWGLYKRVFARPPEHDSIAGTVDFPSLWNQKAREGMRMHWDGNTDVLIERNVVSALSLIGRRIDYLDFERLTRVTDWIIGLLPPRYEDNLPPGRAGIDWSLASRGAVLFQQNCAQCHSPQGDRVGRVEPIAGLGTDPERIAEFTPGLQDALNKLGTSQWQLRHFRGQDGYVNGLLDGIWQRGPYLHNGSVPTIADLLEPPALRPKVFCRGNEVIDWVRLGPVSAPDANGSCGVHSRYDTTVRGNSNAGHLYGTTLPLPEKLQLLEFLKTL